MSAFIGHTPWFSERTCITERALCQELSFRGAKYSPFAQLKMVASRPQWLGQRALILSEQLRQKRAVGWTRFSTSTDTSCKILTMSGAVDVAREGSLGGRGAYRQVPHFTSLETNASILELGSARIFIDPHLVGPLVFVDPRFFAQYKTKLHLPDTKQVQEMRQRIRERFGPITCVVLSQALADHTHEPTLRYLDRQTPIVAPYSARAILSSIGFKNVCFLHPGETFRLECGPEPSVRDEYVEIRAVKGSVVGPPWQDPENGYIFRTYRQSDRASEACCIFRMFYEPHGNFEEAEVRQALASTSDTDGRLIDVVLTPPVRVLFAGLYELLRGAPSAVELVRMLRPQMVIPIRNWEGQQSGLLSMLLRGTGSLEDFRERVSKAAKEIGIPMDIVRVGEAGESFPLPLRPTTG